MKKRQSNQSDNCDMTSIDGDNTLNPNTGDFNSIKRKKRNSVDKKGNKAKTLEGVMLPKDIKKYLADLFKQTRERADATQEEIATKLFDTSQRVYQRWETGNSQPNGSAVVTLYFFKEFLDKEQEEEDKQKNTLRFNTPFEIAGAIAKRLNGIEDIYQVVKQKAEPVIKLIKSFLSYACALGLTDTRYKFDKYPILIEWVPNSDSSPMQVYMYFGRLNRKLVLDARFVSVDGNFDKLEVLVFYHGQWVSILQRAVSLFAAHLCMEIDDSSLSDGLKRALIPVPNDFNLIS